MSNNSVFDSGIQLNNIAKALESQANSYKELVKASAYLVKYYKEFESYKKEKSIKESWTNEIRYYENLIYKTLNDIENFIISCHNSGIQINFDKNELRYTKISLTNLRLLILDYFNFLKTPNLNIMTEEAFETCRKNNFIDKLPPFLTCLSDVLFPKEIYIYPSYSQETFAVTANSVSPQLREATKEDSRFIYKDKIRFMNHKILSTYGPRIGFYVSLKNNIENSIRIPLKDLNNEFSFEFKNKFLTSSKDYSVDVKTFLNWEIERKKKNFDFWNPKSIYYHDSKAAFYDDYDVSDTNNGLHISKKAETSAKIKEEISINNCLVSKLIFNETNPSYRFVLPNEKYDDAYNENSDNIVYFGDITFEINREGIFNKLYEMAIGEYTSIYQNQDLYMQEYIAYLENLLNKYTLIYNNMQIEKLNQSEQKLTLSKD